MTTILDSLAAYGWNFAVNTIAASLYCPAGLRYVLLKYIAGYYISKRSVGARCFFAGRSHLKIGEGGNLGTGSHVELWGDITIGKNVHMAPCCVLITGNT